MKKSFEDMKPQNVDEIISGLYQVICQMDVLREKYNMDEHFGQLMINADNPDARLKVNTFIRVISEMDQIKVALEYLNKPIKFEGVLQQMTDGTVHLNETVINEGTKIEYLAADQWNIGYIKKNPKTFRGSIYDDKGKIIIEKIDQIKARIR